MPAVSGILDERRAAASAINGSILDERGEFASAETERKRAAVAEEASIGDLAPEGLR